MKCEAVLTYTEGQVRQLICHGRQDGHKGMHHDWMARIYWLVRADGSVDYLAEGPRS